jgi:hypothetical protein
VDAVVGERKPAPPERLTTTFEPQLVRRHAPASADDDDAAMAQVEQAAHGENPGFDIVERDEIVGRAGDSDAHQHGRNMDLLLEASAVPGVRPR